MEDLDALGRFREAIDGIDGRLLELLNERARLAQEIGKIKERHGRPVYAPERAEQLMRRLVDHSKGPLDGQAIRAIYREIMSASLALEKDTVIASEGAPGGLSHLAAKEQFGSSVRYTFHPNPETLFDAIATGAADCGVIPFGEEGPDGGHMELLAGGRVFICSQIILGDEETVAPKRYLVLASTLNAPSGHDQTALLMHLTDRPGALVAALEPFRASGVNIFSIHNRRSFRGGLFLLLEVEGHATDEAVRRCFDALNSSGVDSKLCGSYPRLH